MEKQEFNKLVNQITKNQICIDLKIAEAKLKSLENYDTNNINKILQVMMLKSTIEELKFMMEIYN